MSDVAPRERKKLFVAFATDNMIANLPPILELATAEKDEVVWLETPHAAGRKLAHGATSVLKDRNIGCTLRSVQSDLSDIHAQMAALREKCLNEDRLLVWVANGGTKPFALTLFQDLSRGNVPFAIAYGEGDKAIGWVRWDGMASKLEPIGYERSAISLEVVLRTSGHRIERSETYPATKFWSRNGGAEQLPSASKYGIDPTATARAHRDAALAAEDRRQREKAEGGDAMVFSAGFRRHEELCRSWLETLWTASQELMQSSHTRPRANEWPRIVEQKRQFIDAVFSSAQNRASKLRALARSGAPTSTTKLGPQFEIAVAHRVRDWLLDYGSDHAINEAWFGVEVWPEASIATSRAGSPKQKLDPKQQLDVCLVLSNGILLSIECKSFDAEKKDLDARLLNLGLVGSRLAQNFVCAPLYSDFADQPWFSKQHEFFEWLNLYNFANLKLTLPGQPLDYAIPGSEQRSPPLQPFEAQLSEILQPFSLAA